MTGGLFASGADYAMTVPGERLSFTHGSWIFRLPRELRGLNATMWRHWSVQRRERETWEQEFHYALYAFKTMHDVSGWSAAERAAFLVLLGQKERRRVRVFRFVPSARNFLHDDDNLAACTKHLVDAMKRQGLLFEDRRGWLEQLPTEQYVSPDKSAWTVIKLDRPDVRGGFA